MARIKAKTLLAALSIFILIVSGCATIFTGTTDVLTFNSDEKGVKLYIDGQYHGEIPMTITMSRNFIGGQEFVAKFEKEGFITQQFRLKRTFNTVAILDISSTIVSGGIDVLTGALIKFSPTEYHIQMVKIGASGKDAEYTRNRNIYEYTTKNYSNILHDLTFDGGMYLDAFSTLVANSDKNISKSITKELLLNKKSLLETNDIYDFLNKVNLIFSERSELQKYKI